MSRHVTRWAILGTGTVARRFAEDMRFSRTGMIAAVGSRSLERARFSAAAVGRETAFGQTAEILARGDIDAVYVATPNATHGRMAQAAIAAGKAVLIEKPLATTAAEGAAIADAAREAGVLAMEAMWMRFTPGIVRLKRMIDEGTIGEVCAIEAGLRLPQPFAADHPLFDPASGGALLDLGVYAVSLALHLAGDAHDVASQLSFFDNGAVAAAALSTRHGSALGSLTCGFDAEGLNQAVVTGTRGVLTAHGPFFCPALLSLRMTRPVAAVGTRGPGTAIAPRPRLAKLGALRHMASAAKTRRIPTLFEGTGLHYQADHFAECLGRGLLDSPVMPLGQSIAALGILETARG